MGFEDDGNGVAIMVEPEFRIPVMTALRRLELLGEPNVLTVKFETCPALSSLSIIYNRKTPAVAQAVWTQRLETLALFPVVTDLTVWEKHEARDHLQATHFPGLTRLTVALQPESLSLLFTL